MSIVFKGRVFSVEVEQRKYPNGSEHEIQVVRHSPSVVIIPMRSDGQVILIRQYRASVDRELWEVPAGRVDAGETPEDAVKRECEEEIGLVPRQLQRIRGLYPAPGFCDEELIFFRVSDLVSPPPDSPHKPDEDEYIHVQPHSVAAAKAMVTSGQIVDLKTAYALTLI
jgi:ADP-ribose pyrophosphatase